MSRLTPFPLEAGNAAAAAAGRRNGAHGRIGSRQDHRYEHLVGWD